MISMENPSIDIGVRGLSYIEVEVTGPNRDLHSGVYGGAVANPITMLAKMIASCHDENNHITIPGFYDDVVEVYSGRKRIDGRKLLTMKKNIKKTGRKRTMGRKRIYH